MLRDMEKEQYDYYLNEHLPYIMNSLLAHDLMLHRKNTESAYDELKESCYGDSLVLNPAFEISIVFGRALLQFLGLGYEYKANRLIVFNKKADDYTIKDLFPNRSYCPLSDEIVIANGKELCTIMKIANKSVAHITTILSNGDEHELVKKARMSIYELMLKYVPEINKEKLWWYSQVECVRKAI
jgi:hypothetical protein